MSEDTVEVVQHKTLAAAISGVMTEIGYVSKGGKMSYGDKYSYARETDFIRAVRPLMVKHGVVMFPSSVENVALDTFETSRGGVMNRIVAVFNFTIAHRDSGEVFQVAALGEGSDVGDKSANKAATAALKYALRQSFIIETGDDPDDTPSATQERAALKYGDGTPVPANKRVSDLFRAYRKDTGNIPENGDKLKEWAAKSTAR